MTKPKFTPGPLIIIKREVGEMVNGSGAIWTECAIECQPGGPGTIIAECFGRSAESTFHNAVANASLFAAAPEMYSMLERCAEALGTLRHNEAAEEIDALLAKARGES